MAVGAWTCPAKTIYVSAGGGSEPIQDGVSWATAFTNVQNALVAARPGDEVWVAAGVYRGMHSLLAGVKLYGGFSGSETNLEQRDWMQNESVLEPAFSRSVITVMPGATNDTRIDGLTIRGGATSQDGGGILCQMTSPIIANNRIAGNSADRRGAGVYLLNTWAIVTNNFIVGNAPRSPTVPVIGGGIYCESGAPQITYNVVMANSGHSGGGISCFRSEAIIAHNLIAGNRASLIGGGIECNASAAKIFSNRILYNRLEQPTGPLFLGGGGIGCFGSAAAPAQIANNLILGNMAASILESQGGGVYAQKDSAPTLLNNTIANNQAARGGGIFLESTNTVLLGNNLIAFNSSGIEAVSAVEFRYNCIFGNGTNEFVGVADPTGSEGNISADPRLVENPVYADARILPDSPCRDAGADDLAAPDWLDFEGQPRLQGAAVDIGADESDGVTAAFEPLIVRVSPSGNDDNDGSSWRLAKRTVQAAIDAAATRGGEVWVSQGLYPEQVQLRLFTYLFGGFRGFEQHISERDWDRHPAILDGQQLGRVVTIQYLDKFCAIDGFVIQNGSADIGGGVLARHSAPWIQHNLIRNNRAVHGGGIKVVSADPVIINNRIVSNTAEPMTNVAYWPTGGGIYALGSQSVIANNLIANNSAVATNNFGRGGGLACEGDVQVFNNTLLRNQSLSLSTNAYGGDSGGNVYINYAACYLANNLIAFGSSGIKDASLPSTAKPQYQNNCIFGNAASDYIGSANPIGTNGNINADPLISNGDNSYLLQPDSPCVDAGDDSVVGLGLSDLDGEPRLVGSHVDIGADEYVSELAWQPMTDVQDRVQVDVQTIGGLSYGIYSAALANASERLAEINQSVLNDREFAVEFVFEKLTEPVTIAGLPRKRVGIIVLGALAPGDYQVKAQSAGADLQSLTFVVAQDTERTLESPRLLPGNRIGFELIGLPGVEYLIQASSDLKAWELVATNWAGTVQLDIADGQSHRFFRAAVSP